MADREAIEALLAKASFLCEPNNLWQSPGANKPKVRVIPTWEEQPPDVQGRYLQCAAAAVTALREAGYAIVIRAPLEELLDIIEAAASEPSR